MTWFTEMAYPGFTQSIAVTETLFRGSTAHQNVEVHDTALFGRMLILDGAVQLTEADHHVYHEMFAHVPLFAHGAAADVLIIGGGDGGLLREVLKHPVESVTLVEIDPEIVALSRAFLPSVSGNAFCDDRLEFVAQDGASFVKRDRRKFDLVLIDSTDPVGVAEPLFTREFYAHCRERMRKDGAIVIQGGAPMMARRSEDPFRSNFGWSESYVAPVPSYPTGMILFRAATIDGWSLNPPLNVHGKRLQRSGVHTRFYRPETHRAAFDLLSSWGATVHGQEPCADVRTM
jgi:spermidine synthase